MTEKAVISEEIKSGKGSRWSETIEFFLIRFNWYFTYFLRCLIPYYGWRITGGLNEEFGYEHSEDDLRAFKKAGLTKKEIIARDLGFTEGSCLSFQTGKNLYIDLIGETTINRCDGNGPDYYKLGEKVKLSEEPADKKRILVTFEKIYKVNPKKLKYGCCKAYSLPKAMYFIEHLGGDPVCGGGFKHFFGPRWQMYYNFFQLRSALKSKNFIGYVEEFYHDGEYLGNCYFYDSSNGFMTVYLGEKEDIDRFLNENGNREYRLRAVRISIN